MPQNKEEMKTLHIRFPLPMKEKIKQLAESRGWSESLVIRELVKKSLETA
jgi:predicted DNA-binding protein